MRALCHLQPRSKSHMLWPVLGTLQSTSYSHLFLNSSSFPILLSSLFPDLKTLCSAKEQGSGCVEQQKATNMQSPGTVLCWICPSLLDPTAPHFLGRKPSSLLLCLLVICPQLSKYFVSNLPGCQSDQYTLRQLTPCKCSWTFSLEWIETQNIRIRKIKIF